MQQKLEKDVFQSHPGKSYPLGAKVFPDGVNFCLFSKSATKVELCLFEWPEDSEPFQIFTLDPEKNRSFYYWHIFVIGLTPGILYGYRVHGPNDPSRGLRFDGDKLLIDPYTRALATGRNYHRLAAAQPGSNVGKAMKCVVIDPDSYDWEGDEPVHHPYSKSIIYELHVGGFTRNPNSNVTPKMMGTYAGLIEKIPYLQDLGITTVELMPVIQFDPLDVPEPYLVNYWGYSPIAFFAPHNGYCYCDDPDMIADEFRNMIKALHKANIEVILDVVFNHTAEGDHTGPTLSFKGLSNSGYYILAEDPRYYADFTGCGNTINTNHSVVRRMILDALKRWVIEMHVDGFRFDLASIMSRDERGRPIDNPPILWAIESDPVLSRTKIIAEAWDTGGLYQVGSFIGDKWAEWNGNFRDDIRRFLRADFDSVSNFACRLTGSPDLYQKPFRDPNRSINFVTCHDGFTLNDLVSYNVKHNELNGISNQGGASENFSFNFGVEGPTDDPEIQKLRIRQIKNFFTILLLSQGTPMLGMGDEVRRTQQGNNNPYCQDNEISWFDWNNVSQQEHLFKFVRQLIRFRQDNEIFQFERSWSDNVEPDKSRIIWHGVRLGLPDWGSHSHSLAYTLIGKGYNYHFMVNAYWESLEFQIPQGEAWYRIIDTFLEFPEDFSPYGTRLFLKKKYLVNARSAVVLMAKKANPLFN